MAMKYQKKIHEDAHARIQVDFVCAHLFFAHAHLYASCARVCAHIFIFFGSSLASYELKYQILKRPDHQLGRYSTCCDLYNFENEKK